MKRPHAMRSIKMKRSSFKTKLTMNLVSMKKVKIQRDFFANIGNNGERL